MLNWLDIVILVVVVFAAVRGGSVGFIRSVIGLISLVAAFFTANIYYDNLARLIVDQTPIRDGLQNFFSKDLFSGFSIPEIDMPVDWAGFQTVETYLDRLFVRSDFISDSITMDFGAFMAQILVNILAWIVVFLVALLVVRLLGVILEEIFKLPLLKSLNALAGFAVGVVKGTFFVFLLVLLLQFIGQISQGEYLTNLVESSYFAYFVLKYNIFRWIII